MMNTRPSLLSLIHSDFLLALNHQGWNFAQQRPNFRTVWRGLRSPGFWAAAVQRLGHHIMIRFAGCAYRPLPAFLRGVYFLGHQVILIAFKISIEKNTPIGPGLQLSNQGEIVIGAKQIGANCRIGHKVTIGVGGINRKKPSLGDDITIGTESIIFGDIKIGNNVTILPHTVCSKTIPDHCIVGGNPARILRRHASAARCRFRPVESDTTEIAVAHG